MFSDSLPANSVKGIDETIRLSVEFKKQQLQEAAIRNNDFKSALNVSNQTRSAPSTIGKLPGTKAVTEYKYLDGSRPPQRLPRIVLAKTHRNLMYIRVHRREVLL